MTHTIFVAVSSLSVGAFIGFIVSSLAYSSKIDGLSQQRADEEQMEAILANGMERELALVRRMN